MAKLAMIGNGCNREIAMELNFIEEMKLQNIERSISLEESDYILYITCGGVGDTIYKCLDEIQDLVDYQLHQNLNLKIIIVGCLTEFSYPFEKIAQLENVKVIPNKDWIIPVINYVKEEQMENTLQTKLKNRTRFFYGSHIKAQFFLESGCVNHCSFCKNNYFSRKVESMPYEATSNYLKKLIQEGTSSLCLSGDNTTIYGIDLEKKRLLHKMIHELSKEENLIKLSIYEIVVRNMYKELEEELVNNPKVKTISVQLESASNKILKEMNRGYTIEQYDELVSKLVKNNKFITTILMSGFPSETYEDLAQTIDYVKKRQIFIDSICQYIDFEGIPSSKLEQLPKSEKRKHTLYLKEKLREHNYEVLKNNLQQMDQVIVAGRNHGYTILEGNTPVYALSNLKVHEGLELGTILTSSPKKLVKKSSFHQDMVYKY